MRGAAFANRWRGDLPEAGVGKYVIADAVQFLRVKPDKE